MQILKSYNPIVLELDSDEICIIHFALYQMKDWLKHTDKVSKKRKRIRLKRVNKMITLVDLLI